MSSSAMPRTAAVAVTAAVALFSSVLLSKKWIPSLNQTNHRDAKDEELSSTHMIPSRDKATMLFSAIYSLYSSILSGKWRRSLITEQDANQPSLTRSVTRDRDPKISYGKRRATLDQEIDLLNDGVVVKPIGVVKSIYRLCVGTPRQGLLAPHARGRIELSVESDAVLGLEGYSHIWIVFLFHLNTVSKNQNNKVSPPALGGEKVGVLATRSPHRPNPVGITLCKLDHITLPTKICKRTYLEISGLDLVDGTPVLDVKPYVPHYDSVNSPQLPPWVSNGLATRRNVTFAPKAQEELESLLTNDTNCLEFYGPHQRDESLEVTLENIKQCIEEVLGFDVRSTWQTKKVRKGKFQAERAERVQEVLGTSSQPLSSSDDKLLCTQQLDNLLIHYTVEEPSQHNRTTSQGSGAEDSVTVQSIQLLVPEKSQELALKSTTRETPKANRGLAMNALQVEHPIEKDLILPESVPDAKSRTPSGSHNLHEAEAKEIFPCVPDSLHTKPRADEDDALKGNVEDMTEEEAVGAVADDNEYPDKAEPLTNKQAATEVLHQASDENSTKRLVQPATNKEEHAEAVIDSLHKSPEVEEKESADNFTQKQFPESPKSSTEAIEPSSKTSKRQLKSASVPVVIAESQTTLPRPPLDADYKSLKSYWAEAASQNTPTGLLPEKGPSFRRRQSSQRSFKFSDKPIPVNEPANDSPALEEKQSQTPVTQALENATQVREQDAVESGGSGATPEEAERKELDTLTGSTQRDNSDTVPRALVGEGGNAVGKDPGGEKVEDTNVTKKPTEGEAVMMNDNIAHTQRTEVNDDLKSEALDKNTDSESPSSIKAEKEAVNKSDERSLENPGVRLDIRECETGVGSETEKQELETETTEEVEEMDTTFEDHGEDSVPVDPVMDSVGVHEQLPVSELQSGENASETDTNVNAADKDQAEEQEGVRMSTQAVTDSVAGLDEVKVDDNVVDKETNIAAQLDKSEPAAAENSSTAPVDADAETSPKHASEAAVEDGKSLESPRKETIEKEGEPIQTNGNEASPTVEAGNDDVSEEAAGDKEDLAMSQDRTDNAAIAADQGGPKKKKKKKRGKKKR